MPLLSNTMPTGSPPCRPRDVQVGGADDMSAAQIAADDQPFAQCSAAGSAYQGLGLTAVCWGFDDKSGTAA